MSLHRHKLIISVIWIACVSLVIGQDRESSSRDLLGQKDRVVSQPAILNPLPLDAPLDPASYRVGSGDLISIQINSVSPVVFTLTVGVDGQLMIPTVGEARVGGLTLAEAQVLIKRLIADRYLRTPVSVGLAMARRVLVRVRGSGVIPQTYEGSASDRVSTILSNQDIVRPMAPVGSNIRRKDVESVSLARRSIHLRRWDGSQQRVDLDKFVVTRNSIWNPHIAEGDEIIADVFDDRIASVAIGGAVWVPGEYEFIEGDRVGDLVHFANGVRPEGKGDSIVFAQLGLAVRHLNIMSADSLILLRQGDRIWVPTAREILGSQIVSVTGEIRYPGSYPVTTGVTRLSDLISMAGGATDDAMLSGATLHRTQSPVAIRTEEHLLAQRGLSALEDTTYLRQEEELRLLGERVNVDFRNALSHPGSSNDPLVNPGDRVVIPRKTGTIYVFGQVVSPGLVAFIPGNRVDAYIQASGGTTDIAKSDDIMIIKRASRQWLGPNETTIEEGDAIWVPKQIERDFVTEFSPYSQIAGVVSAVATVILVITQLSK